MTVAQIKEAALAVRPSARLRLVQDIWDSLVEEPDSVQIPRHHRRLIDQRLAEHDANPTSAITLTQVKSRIRKQLNGKRAK